MCFYLASQFYLRRSWIGLVVMMAFTIRIGVALAFLTDIQYTFVIDGLGYEFESWELAKSWASSARNSYQPIATLGSINAYKVFLAGIFYLFGREVFIGMIINALIASLNVFVIYKMVERFFMFSKIISDLDVTEKSLAALFLTFYPSFVIWSATNIRDPMYFMACTLFFYFLFSIFSKKSRWHFSQKLGAVAGIMLSFALILSLRFYVGVYFIGSVLFGIFFYRMTNRFGFKASFIAVCMLVLGSCLIMQYAFTDWTTQQLSRLTTTRWSFSNLGYDDVAMSSFDLDYQFTTVWDVLAFIPTGLANYFFGPFPWNVTSFLQGLAQLEVILVYLLTIPTIIGVRKAYQYAKFETTLVVTFCMIIAILQSVTISNLGTLFRHRTLAFILLSIFTGVGLMEMRRRLIVRYQRHQGRPLPTR
jgi:hypothetical protein